MLQRFLRVNEEDYTVRPMYTTPCCGAKHYDFLDEPRTCFSCGKDWSHEPAEFVPDEKDLSHLRFIAVTRYVS